MLCSRQVGKTHAVSLGGAYNARYRRRRVGVLSPTSKMSMICYRRMRDWLTADRTDFGRVTNIELEIERGGAVASFPGDRPELGPRGDTLDDLIVDEASRVKDQLITSAAPTQATKKRFRKVYLSSPFGQRGMFYRAWTSQTFWTKYEIRADMCPRISEEFLSQQRQELGALYEQEYECKFLASAGGVIHAEALEAAFGPKMLGMEPEGEWPKPRLAAVVEEW